MKMHAKRTIAAMFGTIDTLKIAVSASREFNQQAALRRARGEHRAPDLNI